MSYSFDGSLKSFQALSKSWLHDKVHKSNAYLIFGVPKVGLRKLLLKLGYLSLLIQPSNV